MRYLYLSVLQLSIIIAFAQQTSKTIIHDGLNRNYIEYVPAVYNDTQAVPLVVCLHGLGDNMNNFVGIGMNNIADTANFIVLTPEAVADPYFGTAWNSGASYMGFVLNANVDDVGFIRAIIDSTMSLYHIDTTRIYVMGFSMGGFMTNRLACELNYELAAVAAVAGTMGTSMTCTNDNPIPYCHFHGTADSTVYYTNNMYGNDAEDVVNFWVTKNSCNTVGDTVFMPDLANDGKTIQKITFSGGAYDTEVVFYKVINGAHEWLFTPNNDIDYTKEIWKFFSKFTNQEINSINSYKNDIDFKIYPNPAKSNLKIILPDNNKNKILTVYDIFGHCVISEDIETNYYCKDLNIDVSFLPTGVYFVKLGNSTAKFVRR